MAYESDSCFARAHTYIMHLHTACTHAQTQAQVTLCKTCLLVAVLIILANEQGRAGLKAAEHLVGEQVLCSMFGGMAPDSLEIPQNKL